MNLNHGDVQELLDSLISEEIFSSNRSGLDKLAQDISTFFRDLSLPMVPAAEREANLKLKAFFSFWIINLDDAIDRFSGGDYEIFDCVEILNEFSRDRIPNPTTASGTLLSKLLNSFKIFCDYPNYKIAKDFLILDCMKSVSAFEYERIIFREQELVTFEEYLEHSALTYDQRYIVDIDISQLHSEISKETLGKLRLAYKWFSIGFRLISDIATFDREFLEENSLNAPLIVGMRKGIIPSNALSLKKELKLQIRKEAIPRIFKDLEKEAQEYNSKAIRTLEEIREFDLSPLVEGFKRNIETYPSHC